MACLKHFTAADSAPGRRNVGLDIPKGWGGAESDGSASVIFAVDEQCQCGSLLEVLEHVHMIVHEPVQVKGDEKDCVLIQVRDKRIRDN